MFEPKERRVDQVELIGRRKCNVPAELRDKGIRMPCHVVNISLAGAQVNIGSFSSYVPKGNQWHLEMPAHAPLRVAVRWSGSSELGLQFVDALRPSQRRSFARYLAHVAERYPFSSPDPE